MNANPVPESMPTAEETLTPELDILWYRSNGSCVEIKDMNEFHAKNALRKLITAICEGDRETINEAIYGE